MLKTRKKWISILLTLAMLVGLMVPFAGTAGAVGTVYTTLTAPPVEDDKEDIALGSFQIEIDPLYVSGNEVHEALVELPSDYTINSVTVYGANNSEEILDSENESVSSVSVDVYGGTSNSDKAQVTLSDLSDNSFKISISAPSGYSGFTGNKFRVKLAFTSVDVPSGASGDVTATIKNLQGQLVDGKVVIAHVAGGGLTVSVIDSQDFADEGTVKIRVEETVAGKLKDEDQLKIQLPDGFEWADADVSKIVFGTLVDTSTDPDTVLSSTAAKDKIDIDYTTDSDTLKISLVDSVYKSTERLGIEITAKVKVVDEQDAKYGDVVAKLKGDYTVSPSEIVVGTYGDYEAAVSADDPSIVAYAGMEDQDISDIVIKEGIKGSLINGRSITLTLPENARWYRIQDQNVTPDTTRDAGIKTDEDNNVRLDFVGLQGTDNRTVKFIVYGDSTTATDPAEITIEDLGVALKAGVTGDLKVTVGGTAGVSGEITVAKVVSPVTVTAEKANVQLGKFEQPAGKIVITEAAAGAIDTDNGNYGIELRLPDGIKFSSKPDVTVTKGDLEIDQVSLAADDTVLKISFKDDSNEASTIEISDIYYDVDRTYGEGDIKVEVGGMAIVDTNVVSYNEDRDNYNDSDTYKVFFEDDDYAAKVANAVCVTPAPVGAKYSASFVIGSTTYTVNGVENTMDVAAYTKDGRTYLPVRYVAYALGITPENILWDGKTATFIGEGRVVQVTPGSAVLTINGAPITMDVTTDLVNGRVMVPFRWVAQAFGAQVNYDEATQTVSIN
ncbi:copper amine oxidase N-terminal domain-containing protein [Neomoorella mulderi]|uniref:Copper amine oxidase-like N-terminal domain-containing protein n=1 Tax=Moorella mulderi DSM 14980 TaxID=1122241 RepID=A0A151B1D5_9FIRM|nr:copper amine oxidase N-terminal domain-containing protein [Moorella mulderi]KYH33582.1 hypothetical protein MOMUL_02880 [Moorella mulderi DSM 14980]